MFRFHNPRDPENAEVTRAIKNWVSELTWVSEDGVVMVTEVNCLDDGCPDMETLIHVLDKPHDRSYRIRKPLIFVRRRDVEAVIREAGPVI